MRDNALSGFPRGRVEDKAAVLLAGYSRGSAGVIAIAARLAKDKVNVRSLVLFDPVDRAVAIDASEISRNVEHVVYARRAPNAFTPRTFGNCGTRWHVPNRRRAPREPPAPLTVATKSQMCRRGNVMAPPSRISAAALASCVLGFVLSPAPFIVLAARAELPLMASSIVASAFALSAGFLFTRLLSRPTSEPTGGTAIRLIELGSWATVTSVLVFISNMNLLRGIERFGAASVFFLSASTVCFPLVWVRRTAIEQRITRLPRALVVSALCTALGLSGGMALVYMTTPAQFL